MVAGVVEVAAGREEAGGSCCTGGPIKAGAMVGLGWLRRLLGSVRARWGVPEGGEDMAEALGDDIGVVVEVLPVLPVLALEDVRWCQTLGRGQVEAGGEEEDHPLFDDAQGG